MEAYSIVYRELEQKHLAASTLSKHYALQSAFRQNEQKRLLQHLDLGLQVAGVDKMKTSTASVFYLESESIEVDAKKFIEAYAFSHPQFIRRPDPEPNKTQIKLALKAGEKIEHIKLVHKKTLQLR